MEPHGAGVGADPGFHAHADRGATHVTDFRLAGATLPCASSTPRAQLGHGAIGRGSYANEPNPTH
eukprot:scaffold17821_cov139-Isochrysis_galbana.AAC.5